MICLQTGQRPMRQCFFWDRSTDTQDTTGTVLTENHEKALELDKEQVRQVILGFKGDYDQIPPMYSALKVDGKKLCDLARAGKEVERKARRVQILDISVEKIELPRVLDGSAAPRERIYVLFVRISEQNYRWVDAWNLSCAPA